MKRLCDELKIELANERIQWDELNDRLTRAIEEKNDALKAWDNAEDDFVVNQSENMANVHSHAGAGWTNVVGTSAFATKSLFDRGRLEQDIDDAKQRFEGAKAKIEDTQSWMDDTSENIRRLKWRIINLECVGEVWECVGDHTT